MFEISARESRIYEYFYVMVDTLEENRLKSTQRKQNIKKI